MHYPNLSFAIKCWEELWHGRCVCARVYKWGAGQKATRRRYEPSLPSRRQPWHCETEKTASSKIRCKHVYTMGPPPLFFPSCGTLLRDEHIFFCQLSQCMSSDAHRRASAHDFQQLTATVSPFFSQTLTFWVSFQEKVGSVCRARGKLQALIRNSCRFQSNIEILITKTFFFVFFYGFFFYCVCDIFTSFFNSQTLVEQPGVYHDPKRQKQMGLQPKLTFVISQIIYFQNFLYWQTPEVAQSKGEPCNAPSQLLWEHHNFGQTLVVSERRLSELNQESWSGSGFTVPWSLVDCCRK